MSRLARIPVKLPDAVKLELQDGVVTVSNGKNQAMSYVLPPLVSLELADGAVSFAMQGSERQARINAGTARANVVNMLVGLSGGHEKRLVLEGVGYRAQKSGSSDIELSLGFSHPKKMTPPEGVQVDVPTQTEIVIRGHDRQKVGQFAAELRALRPPEPYNGKGVRYSTESIVLKPKKKKA